MNSNRNRSEGWTHAKRTGHINEEKVDLMFEDSLFRTEFEKRLGISKIIEHSVGGSREKLVDGVLGRKTKSKTDLVLHTEDDRSINISIKKSEGGQVYLIGLESLLSGLEIQFGVKVTDEELEALELYFGSNKVCSIIDSLKKDHNIPERILDYMCRKQRLTADYLKLYNPSYPSALLNWYKKNIDSITRFCFSSGLAADRNNWAEYVWYINLIDDEKWGDLDTIFKIDDFCNNNLHLDTISYGKSLGGSTIQLPFGSVQWHQGQPQFRHDFKKINNLLK